MAEREPVEVTVEIDGREVTAGTLWVHERGGQSATFRYSDSYLTDPAGYTFGVATDSACRNRLLHSRPIEASEYLPRLWRAGIRGFRAVFNVPGDPVREIMAAYRSAVEALAGTGTVTTTQPAVRELVGGKFTRGHFARAV